MGNEAPALTPEQMQEVVAEKMQQMKANAGQGVGFAGKLYVVWGTLMLPVHDAVISMDMTEGRVIIATPITEQAVSINIMKNENVVNLVAGQKEGENITHYCLQEIQAFIINSLLNDSALVIDLGAVLDGMRRKEDANG